MLTEWLHRFRPDPLRARVEDSIRRGTGLSKQEWLINDHPLVRVDIETLADQIIGWCRDRIAETRRPYGIDQLALAIACAEPGGIRRSPPRRSAYSARSNFTRSTALRSECGCTWANCRWTP